MRIHEAFRDSMRTRPYLSLGDGGVSVAGGMLEVEAEAIASLAERAFRDLNFLTPAYQLDAWRGIMDAPGSSDNDRFVAASLVKNAAIAAEGVLPSCQDTGTACCVGFRGALASSPSCEEDAVERGVERAYTRNALRSSQFAPASMLEEADTGNNLPAQVDIHALPRGEGDREYRFLFIAKGGGSANRTGYFSETKALLEADRLRAFMRAKARALGVAGCPPYRLAVVIGGQSPERNLLLQKLAGSGALDALPGYGEGGGLYRDREWEDFLLRAARETGLGAQFGGEAFALSARVVRAARHSASLPVSIGVSCSAHRNAFARIGPDGIELEDLDGGPGRHLQRALEILSARGGARRVDFGRPLRAVADELAALPAGTMVLASGEMLVARDSAHLRFAALLREGKPLPDYLLRHPVYYAGPAKSPGPGRVGSFGPTTSSRMDPYLGALMDKGASLVTVAKGNRSEQAREAVARHRGCYLGTIGGAAALIARDHILEERIIDYAELGMEAVRLVRVENLPMFIAIDATGRSLY